MFRPIARSDAEEISRWRYPEPYATYNGDPSCVPGLLDPRYNYHAVTDPDGELVGYFCFGADASWAAKQAKALLAEAGLTQDADGIWEGKVPTEDPLVLRLVHGKLLLRAKPGPVVDNHSCARRFGNFPSGVSRIRVYHHKLVGPCN